MGAIGYNVKSTIYKDIFDIFLHGSLTHIAYLFILLPFFLVLQISRSELSRINRILFFLEGVFSFIAAYTMYWSMTFGILESNVVRTKNILFVYWLGHCMGIFIYRSDKQIDL